VKFLHTVTARRISARGGKRRKGEEKKKKKRFPSIDCRVRRFLFPSGSYKDSSVQQRVKGGRKGRKKKRLSMYQERDGPGPPFPGQYGPCSEKRKKKRGGMVPTAETGSLAALDPMQGGHTRKEKGRKKEKSPPRAGRLPLTSKERGKGRKEKQDELALLRACR